MYVIFFTVYGFSYSWASFLQCKTRIMKKFFKNRPLLICSVFTLFALSALAQVEISIHCTYSYSYCNGASIGNDKLLELYTPKPSQLDVYLYPVYENGLNKPLFVPFGKSVHIAPGNYLIATIPDLTNEDVKSNHLIKAVKSNDKSNLQYIKVTDELCQPFHYNYHHYCPWQLDPDAAIPN